MVFPAGLRALNHRDFRVFWAGQLVSLVGTWMQSVGQSWLVLELTNSPFRLGLLGALQFAPLMLFSPFAGVVADRLPKRRLLVATQAALLTQALMLATLVWSGHVRYWHVAVLALLLGAVNTVDMPARQSFIAEMVSREDLLNAIALNSAGFNAARVVGPAVAGLLVAHYGIAPAFLLNGLSFVAVILALLTIRAEGRPRARSDASVVEQVVEGIQYALRTPRIARVLGMLFVVSVFVLNFNVLVPLLARDVLHGDARTFGFLMAALGVGALTGALALATLGGGRPAGTTIAVAALVTSGATLAMAAVRHFPLALVLLGVVGAASIVFMASSNSALQLTAPDHLRGRVMSLHALVFAGVVPIGSFLMGAVAERFGVPAAFLSGGGLGLLSVIAMIAWGKRRRLR